MRARGGGGGAEKGDTGVLLSALEAAGCQFHIISLRFFSSFLEYLLKFRYYRYARNDSITLL